jgi:hypothetical protein
LNKKNEFLPKVLVNSVPKSGTHLLMQLILGIPGMMITPTWYYPTTFNSLQSMKSGQMGPAHLHYSPEQAAQLEKWGIKVVFISRDPRDIAVSLVHFIMENKWNNHPFSPYLRSLKTHEDRLLAIIRGVRPGENGISSYGIESWPNIYQYTERQYAWLNHSGICKVTFEDLVRNEQSQNQSIMKIIHCLWNDLAQLQLTKQHILQSMKQNINPSTSGTFRKGKIGSWHDEFAVEHKTAFKKIAGNLLIQLGYEKDHNW